MKFAAVCATVAAMRILNSPDKAGGGNGDRKNLDACTIVIFGASGDLTARKLIPALYHLFKEKQMPADFRVVGFARREKTDASWRQGIAHGAGPVFPHQAGGRQSLGGVRGKHFLLPGRSDRGRGLHKTGNAADLVRQHAAARKPAVLSGHFAQPVWRSGGAGASLRAVEQGRRRAGSASWWKNRSATTWRPRRRSTAN